MRKSASKPVSLPLLARDLPYSQRGCGKPRKSRMGKWRAATLILVHVIVGLHIWHWLASGSTLTPVEPSEAMQTLREGLVNAGFVLLGIAVLGTLIFGRFFCGWGCHIVALQDACTWLLRKAGIHPKPFRSRLLLFVPLLAALYMFFYPPLVRVAERVIYDKPLPTVQERFRTDEFWQTFPGPWVAILTFAVCGPLIVLLLGNKGFCTYACPYGGLFGPADMLAPGKIRVTDACSGCGHCTATCTSNIRVHEEVLVHGMVVSPGCMKCLDCVDVCPKDALYFGFGKPAVARGAARARAPATTYDFAWWEEVLLGLFFLGALFIYRGLYEALPFLLSLGLSAISSYLLLLALRMAYMPSLRLQRLQLRSHGRLTRAGTGYLAFVALLLAFLVHSSLVQIHWKLGQHYATEAEQLQMLNPPDRGRVIELSRRSVEQLEKTRALALAPIPELEARLGALYDFLDQADRAEPHLRRALELQPKFAAARHRLAQLMARRGDRAGGLSELRRAVQDNPELDDARRDLIAAMLAENRVKEVTGILEQAAQRRPRSVPIALDLAKLRINAGNLPQAERELRAVLDRDPKLAEAQINLGLVLAWQGKLPEATSALEKAETLTRDNVGLWMTLSDIYATQGRTADALREAAKAHAKLPLDRDITRSWAHLVGAAGQLGSSIEQAAKAPSHDLATRYGLVFLYESAGRTSERDALFHELRSANPQLMAP